MRFHRLTLARIAAPAILAVAGVAAASAPRPGWGAVVNSVAVDRPIVALTFDDGPHPRHTPAVLDVLRDQGVRATFFLIGSNVRRYPELARRIVREGHAIGNHGDTHRDLTTLSRRAAAAEVARAARAILDATGVRTWMLRPPYGAHDESLRGATGIAAQQRHVLVMWSIQARDWSADRPLPVALTTLQRVRPGSIVLLHDGGGPRQHVVTATRWMVAHLSRRGYRLVTVPELLDSAR